MEIPSFQMINKFVKFDVLDTTLAIKKFTETYKSFTLMYPCSSIYKCTPYKLHLCPGAYKFECWGARGLHNLLEHTARGAYTKGYLSFIKPMHLYVYIGATGFFNAVEGVEKNNAGYPGGGATDIRLETSTNWYDLQSLTSRIMVAAGGGAGEWMASRGGGAGGGAGE